MVHSAIVQILKGDTNYLKLDLKRDKTEFLLKQYKVEDKAEAGLMIALTDKAIEKDEYWKQINEMSFGADPSLFNLQKRLIKIEKPQDRYVEIANYLIENNVIRSDNHTNDFYIYSNKIGRFVDKAEVNIKAMIHSIDESISNQGRSEIISKIQISTPYNVYDFNKHPVIACKNVVINLDTYEITQFSPDYNLTRHIAPTHDPKAESEILNQFLKDITNNNQDMEDSLLEIIADCLNPHYYSQKLHVFIGKGSNGKGAFCRLLSAFLLQKNVSNLNAYQISKQFMTYRLFGSFANISWDTSSKEINYTGIIKNMRGEDWIEADRKNQEPLVFQNTAKGIFCCQVMFTSEDQSDAWYRSWLLYNFDRKFPVSDFEKRLITPKTLSALLNKVLIAHKRLKDNNYHFTWEKYTPTIEDQRIRYDFSSNNVKAFYEYSCEDQLGEMIPKQTLFNHYEDFCRVHNLIPHGERLFAKDLRKYAPSVKTARKTIDKIQVYHWVNIKIIESTVNQVNQVNEKPFTHLQKKYISSTEDHNRKTLTTLTTLTKLEKLEKIKHLIDKWINESKKGWINITATIDSLVQEGLTREYCEKAIDKFLTRGVYFEPKPNILSSAEQSIKDMKIKEPKKKVLKIKPEIKPEKEKTIPFEDRFGKRKVVKNVLDKIVNFSGVSLTKDWLCVMFEGKISEGYMTRIINYLKENKIIYENKFGSISLLSD